MKQRALGRTGIAVSEIGFGAWAIGGNRFGNSLGPTDDAVSREAIETALELGISFFDTADVYGLGHSERLLGEAFAALGGRERAVIATKAGADFRDPHAIYKRYDGPYLREALCRSLERLRTDRVDLFQLHDPPLGAIRSPDTHAAVQRLKEEGLARAVGVSFHTVEEGLATISAGVFDTVQIALSAANQGVARRLLEPAQAHGLGVIAREPLHQGLLAGRYGPDHRFPPGDFRAGLPEQDRQYLAAFARKMREYFHGRRGIDWPLSAIALKFALAEPAVSTVIVSMKTPMQVAENAQVTELPPLGRKELAWLRE